MKYLVVGLGNVGSDYNNTRHNIGFDIVDALCKELNGSFKADTLGDLAEVKFKSRSIYLLKPNTFMNLSGKAVKYWFDKLKIQPENLMVVVDDLHLELGKLRLRDKGSDGGHNGLKDIQERFGHNNYIRLRVGIGKDFHPGQQVNFVLGKWNTAEKSEVEALITKSTTAIKNFTTIGLKMTMDNLNR